MSSTGKSNAGVTYNLVHAYFCSGSSSWPEKVQDDMLQTVTRVLRQLVCQKRVDLFDLLMDIDSLLEGSEVLHTCLARKIISAKEEIFCGDDAHLKFKSVVFYTLYTARCHGNIDNPMCAILRFFVRTDTRKTLIDIINYILPCVPDRSKRQYSAYNLMVAVRQEVCKKEQRVTLTKALAYVNQFTPYDEDDPYRPHVDWDLMNGLAPPFICCFARAAAKTAN